MRRILLIAALISVHGCAHKREPKGLLPLNLIGEDWNGSIRGRTLTIEDGPEPLKVSLADHVVDGPTRLLVNSTTDDGRYVSTLTEAKQCQARGATFALLFSLCLKEKGEGPCLRRLRGCAEQASGKR